MKKLFTALLLLLFILSNPINMNADKTRNNNSDHLEIRLTSAPKPPRIPSPQDPPKPPVTEPDPDPEPEPEPVPEPEPIPEPEPVPEPEPEPVPEPEPPKEPSRPAEPEPPSTTPYIPVETTDEDEENDTTSEEEGSLEEEIVVIDIDDHGEVLWSWKKEFKRLPLPILYDVLKQYLEEEAVPSFEFLLKPELEELLFFLENEKIVSTTNFDELRQAVELAFESAPAAVVEVVENLTEQKEEGTEEVVLTETTEIPLVEVSSNKKESGIQKIGSSIKNFFISIGSFFKGLFS